MKIKLSEVKQIIKEEVGRYKKIQLLEAKKASIEQELQEFLREIEEGEYCEEGIGISLTNKKGMNVKSSVENLKEENSGNEIVHNGKLITKLTPSGMYEFYSDEKGRFLKFDNLNAAKNAIDTENSLGENIMTSKFNQRGQNKKPETPHKKGRY
jgi:hypothetical protein